MPELLKVKGSPLCTFIAAKDAAGGSLLRSDALNQAKGGGGGGMKREKNSCGREVRRELCNS